VHPWRRVSQVLCGILFVILPFTNGMRLDVRREVFYFAWRRMAGQDLFPLFCLAILGLWGLVVVSFLYGRLWCGWVCPQTLVSDFADSLKKRLQRGCRRLLAGRGGSAISDRLAQTIWAVALLAAALAGGYVLACYWLDRATVAAAMHQPESDWSAALTAYGLAAILAADMFWVRRRFCAHACPYGAFISLLADKNTMAVRYITERDDDCIRCGKCVTDCPMDIDIKDGVGQLSCFLE
jgi:polyferredoxin